MDRQGSHWIAAVLFLAGTTPALAASGIVELPEVLVSPRRIPGLAVNASEFPGNATIITAEQIAASAAASIPELLGRVEGVTVMDTHGFGLGADSTVNLRGVVNSSRTGALVLLDGVRLNRVTGDEVHWQSIPLSAIERIEIIRGGGGVIYGEGALAGVINIVTKRTAERPVQVDTGVEFGSYGQERYRASVRGRQGPLTYSTLYERRDITGYRESTTSRTTSIMNHAGIEILPTLHLDAHVLHSEDTSYFAGGITPEQSQARRRQKGAFAGLATDDTTQVGLDARWAGPHGVSVVTNAFWRSRKTDLTVFSPFATLTPSTGLGLRVGHEQTRGDVRHTLVTGVDLLEEKASTGLRGGAFDESNKDSLGLFAEETLRFWDRVSLVVGGRFDMSHFEEAISFPAFEGSLNFDGWSPKAALSVDVLEPLTVYASYARPFKAPNVDDFAAVIPMGGFVFASNINLQPQQADDYELGMRWDDERLGSAEAAWFYTRFHDEILFNDLPGADQNQNFDTRRTGLELSASPRLPWEALDATLTYTFVDAEFRKGAFGGQTLPGVPEHRVTTQLAYEPLPGMIWTLDWLLVQDFFRINDFTNSFRADNYGVLNLGVRLVYDNYTVHFKIENLTNEEYTSFQSSTAVAIATGENPAPPTTISGGVTFTF